MTQKKLHKSDDNKVLAGIIGGLGKYFNVDPVVLRVIWILTVIFTGFFPGVLAYIIFLFIVPRKHIAG